MPNDTSSDGTDRRSIRQEVVLRVSKTPKGAKVVEKDGTGLAEGYLTKRTRRYFYGDDGEDKATEYAYRVADKIRKAREVPVTVVELGEITAKKLAEQGRPSAESDTDD